MASHETSKSGPNLESLFNTWGLTEHDKVLAGVVAYGYFSGYFKTQEEVAAALHNLGVQVKQSVTPSNNLH